MVVTFSESLTDVNVYSDVLYYQSDSDQHRIYRMIKHMVFCNMVLDTDSYKNYSH